MDGTEFFANFPLPSACVAMAAFIRGALPAVLAAALCACGNKPEGTYQSANGTLSVEFKSGRAYVTMLPASALEVAYEVEGDRVTLNVSGEKLVFIRHNDDS